MGKIVFKLIKPKERKKETRVFVTDGRNAHSAVLNIKSSPQKPHKCYHATCSKCGEFTHVAHRCYIQPIEKEAPPQQQDDSFDDQMNFNDDEDNNHDLLS